MNEAALISQFSHELKTENIFIDDNDFTKIEANADVDWDFDIKKSSKGSIINLKIKEIRLGCKVMVYDTTTEESYDELISEEEGWEITVGDKLSTPIRPAYITVYLKPKRAHVHFNNPLNIKS